MSKVDALPKSAIALLAALADTTRDQHVRIGGIDTHARGASRMANLSRPKRA